MRLPQETVVERRWKLVSDRFIKKERPQRSAWQHHCCRKKRKNPPS